MPWLPEMLQKKGVQTAAVLGDYLAFTREGWNMGYDRGFAHYDTSTHINMQGGMFYGFPGAEMVDKATRWLDQTGGKPFMLWMHLVEPHAKYERARHAPSFGDDEQELYASDIWAVDEQVGRLIAYLTDKGLLDSTLVVVTGDHGEEFGEHGNKYHYSSLYEQQVRTVGVMHVPGVGHRRVKQAVVHQDLTTTAMNLLGIREGFEQLRGRNLIPTFEGERVEPSSFFIELAGFQVRVRSFALVDWPFKLLHPKGSTIYTLFQLEKDPGERDDVATNHPEVHARMKEAMIRHEEAIGEHLEGGE
jgi:arylsulfatase A-like enzyme